MRKIEFLSNRGQVPCGTIFSLTLALTLALPTPFAAAQTNTTPGTNPNQRINELEKKLQKSQEMIDALLGRIQALEALINSGKNATPIPAPAPIAAKPAIPAAAVGASDTGCGRARLLLPGSEARRPSDERPGRLGRRRGRLSRRLTRAKADRTGCNARSSALDDRD